MFAHQHRIVRALALATAGLLAGVLAGCGGGGSSSGASATGGATAPSSSPPMASQTTSPPAGVTGSSRTGAGGTGPASSTQGAPTAKSQTRLLQAAATAEKAVPHGTLISIESEQGGARWEGQVVTSDGTEHEMDMSRSGRKVISGPTKKREDAHDRAKHRSRVQAAELDYRQAARNIATAVPGGHITELGLDSHRGTTVWEADVIKDATKHEVTLDAKTGKVLLNRTD